MDQTDTIPIAIGWNELAQPVLVDIAKDAAHWLIQGKTRSGKSQCTYNLLAQAGSNPAVRVVGVDPTSVLLAPFVHRRPAEPNIELGLNDFDKVLRVLQFVKAESDRRIECFWDRRIDKISLFSPALPLILLVLEEFPGIIEGAQDFDATNGLKPADRYALRITSLVRQIAAQSAKAGIRMLLLAQRAEASIVGGNARSNFAVKMTLRVDEPESVKMLHPNATPEECALVEGFVPGQGFFDQPGLRRQMIRTVRVGEYSTYASYVENADLAYEAALNIDRAQRMTIASEYPHLGDIG